MMVDQDPFFQMEGYNDIGTHGLGYMDLND